MKYRGPEKAPFTFLVTKIFKICFEKHILYPGLGVPWFFTYISKCKINLKPLLIMSEYSEKMNKAIEATEREFSKIRAGQASPAILNDVRIDYYGTPTPISQVAKVSVPEPRMLLVSPWEKTMVDPIEKAILAANIGLTPMKDGNCIRVTLPILTTERRQELAKLARKHAEEGRVAIRNIRRDANDALKKNKELPEDEVKKQQDEVQKATDKAIAEIDRLLAEKEADILKV